MKHATVRFKTIGTYGMVYSFYVIYMYIAIENIIDKNWRY